MIATYTRTNPFPAKLISCEVLTKPGSSKEILHVVLDLADSGIVYEVGTSFGLIPENSPAAVEAIMAHVQDGPVQLKTGETVPFREFLTRHANLYQVTSRHFALAGAEAKPCNLALFLQEHPTLPLQAIVDVTAPLLPRYYSIASSMKHVGNQVHFMIASFAYTDALGLPRQGEVASLCLRPCKGKVA